MVTFREPPKRHSGHLYSMEHFSKLAPDHGLRSDGYKRHYVLCFLGSG
jgi:hypothetical protein